MEWMLMVGVAMNDPNPVELARVASQEDCRRAELIFWNISGAAAKERGQDATPDLYLTCRKSKKQGD
ncbi:hypothetical protein D3C80_429610 [compost metagenome]